MVQYWEIAENLTTDVLPLDGVDDNYIAIPKGLYDELMKVHKQNDLLTLPMVHKGETR